MSLYVSPCFSSLLGFISSLPQLAWTKDYVVVVVVEDLANLSTAIVYFIKFVEQCLQLVEKMNKLIIKSS
jgi:hypothetical protein